MDNVVQTHLSSLKPGPEQRYERLTLVPLFSDEEPRVAYSTLSTALKKRAIRIEEVSSAGSVPNLRVVNVSDEAVLLLDGEELAGAKQNRVLNTTILVAAHSELVIPVSCTEQGRWSYTSSHFSDSEVMMPSFLRSMKSLDVNESLRSRGEFRADQGAVWEGVARMHQALGTESPTGAMRDAYEARRDWLDEHLEAFKCLPGQKGLAVAHAGRWFGVEVVSRPDAYAALHNKLVGSYAMDALLHRKRERPGVEAPLESFLSLLSKCSEMSHPSVGLGVDYRYVGERVVGSSLVYEGEVVHMAFFPADGPMSDAGEGPLAGWHRRRDFRIY
jgi:hypothetical protein